MTAAESTIEAAPFGALTTETARTLSTWLADYITAPHPELGRTGAICPFVEPALRAESLIAVTLPWREDDGLPAMTRMIHDAMQLFADTPWKSRNPAMRSLIVIVEGLPEEDWHLIDEAHLATKDEAVANGYMLGQFHPRCPAPAARNAGFPVNRGPFPMIAIRNMAFHDILFLGENTLWFKYYRERFERYYISPGKLDPHLAELYREAVRRLEGNEPTAASGCPVAHH